MTIHDKHLGAVEEDLHGFAAFENLPGMPRTRKKPRKPQYDIDDIDTSGRGMDNYGSL